MQNESDADDVKSCHKQAVSKQMFYLAYCLLKTLLLMFDALSPSILNIGCFLPFFFTYFALSEQGRHCPTLAGMARVQTPVSFAHLISFLSIFSCFLPLCHRILPIVSPVFELFKTPGMAIAIPAILVSPPLLSPLSPCRSSKMAGI